MNLYRSRVKLESGLPEMSLVAYNLHNAQKVAEHCGAEVSVIAERGVKLKDSRILCR